MFSIWEQETFLHSDVLIVGAGITGLSTAAALLERHPNARVRILERGLLPTGASTKNAGFACLGSLSEFVEDIATYGKAPVAEALQQKKAGLQLLRQRLGDDAIGYEAYGGYELLLPKQTRALEQLDELNHWAEQLTGSPLFVRQDNKLKHFGFPEEQIAALIHLPQEGQLDTGKMMQSLLRYVRERGAEILTGCTVTALEESDSCVRAVVENPITKKHFSFTAERLACCTNGFARQLFPELALQPGRGQVLITEPLDELPFCGAFHFDAGYFYFRNVQNRILLGGGRNHAPETETTTEAGETSPIQQLLEDYLYRLILPKQRPRISHRWSGIMGFQHEQLLPIVGARTPRIVLGVGMNGMGVALGSRVGEQVAARLL